ncbi:MAG: GIY-YIG nuclease family protein [Amphiplicatus sp.]
MNSLQQLTEKLDEYQRLYGKVVSDKSEDMISIESVFNPPQSWDLGSQFGVYCIYDQDRELLYIGKASCASSIGSRLTYWFGIKTFSPRGNWRTRPAFFFCIATTHHWEAPSLEEFLITELSPRENAISRKRRIVNSND